MEKLGSYDEKTIPGRKNKDMKLSVITPGIRPGNWRKLYNSIKESFTREFEAIFIGPYPLPKNMEGIENVKWIEDWGSPTRAQQRGLLEAKGEYITHAADDGYFLPGALDIAIKSLEGNNNSIVVAKYNEGAENKVMDDIKYYYISTHESSRCKYIPENCLMLMVPIIPREILLEVGGWDCIFESLPMAFNDLSIRFYNKKVNFIFQEQMAFKCGHMPGREGDHAPIHDSQTFFDTPMFKMIYSRPESLQRINIDINNWEKSPSRWVRRFGK